MNKHRLNRPGPAPEALCPPGLDDATRTEWLRVAHLLAAADHLEPWFVDTIAEYARVTVRLREPRAAIGGVSNEVREVTGRHGPQIKLHPLAREVKSALHQWRALACELGLTPLASMRLPPAPRALADDDPAAEFYVVK